MWRNTGSKTFQDVAADWGVGVHLIRGFERLLRHRRRLRQRRCAGPARECRALERFQRSGSTATAAAKAGANYLKIRLTGVTSARDGTGARIEVRTGSNVAVRYNSGTEQSNLPFGLGSAKTADLVKVYWPSGKVSEAKNVPGNQWLEVVEPSVSRFEVVRGRFTWPEAVADATKRGGRPAVLSTAGTPAAGQRTPNRSRRREPLDRALRPGRQRHLPLARRHHDGCVLQLGAFRAE
jgi:hypothetical protein